MKDPKTDERNVLRLYAGKDDSGDKCAADSALKPAINAAPALKKFSPLADTLDLTTLVQSLNEQSAAVNGGDLKRAEAMLITQAHTLDTVFNQLLQRAALNIGAHLGAVDTYMKLAMRAQNQCRATLQTLGELKNPAPIAFVKQANITSGPQQINNGQAVAQLAPARENANQQSELLEVLPSERLDARAPSPTSRVNTHLEAVGAIHGAQDTRR